MQNVYCNSLHILASRLLYTRVSEIILYSLIYFWSFAQKTLMCSRRVGFVLPHLGWEDSYVIWNVALGLLAKSRMLAHEPLVWLRSLDLHELRAQPCSQRDHDPGLEHCLQQQGCFPSRLPASLSTPVATVALSCLLFLAFLTTDHLLVAVPRLPEIKIKFLNHFFKLSVLVGKSWPHIRLSGSGTFMT